MCVHQYDDIFFCIISFLKCRSCIYTIIILCVYMNLRSIQSSWAGQKSTPHNRSTHSISSIQSYIQQQDSTFCVNKFQVSKYTCSFSQASFLVYYLIFHSNCQLKPSPNVHLFLVVHMKYIFLKQDQIYKSCTNYKICEFCTQVHIIYVLVFDVVRVEVFNHDKDLINQSHHSSLKAIVKQCNFPHFAAFILQSTVLYFSQKNVLVQNNQMSDMHYNFSKKRFPLFGYFDSLYSSMKTSN